MASVPTLSGSGLHDPSRGAALIAIGAGVAAALVVLGSSGNLIAAAGFLATALVAIGVLLLFRRLYPPASGAAVEPDWSLARSLADALPEAIAVTDRAGRLVCANGRYQERFAGVPTPPGLPIGEAAVATLGTLGRAAWRDGSAAADRLPGASLSIRIERAGEAQDLLLWRFGDAGAPAPVANMAALISGEAGERLGRAGIMLALLDAQGHIRAANPILVARAAGRQEAAIVGRDFARFLVTDARGLTRFEQEGEGGTALRIVQIPYVDGSDGEGAPILVALLDEDEALPMPAIGASASAHVHSLVSLMPFGVALVDRDGRFVQMNDAFAKAAQVDPAHPPLYPGDLLVREDKGVVSDAVRRFASGAQHSTDLAVRLKDRPDEPVALGIAGARGLGDAAVLLSLKDNSEESRLKREVAQATKMQAVGQLAGGVAHDFNNILTAIIGHCDLMLMRHSPGDSDYDDIQQIRANSNRAASLTRQLLAFSRQQTLRPQVLQLPDVVSEVSNLLKRLLGETVQLEVRHGRALGAVRADPGQLEQVVVNLAVNARDAMAGQGGGTLAIHTFGVSADQVRAMGSDILPTADYVALAIADTGTGIPTEILPKIFEPFFTTKEVGKGTGLGLSTVYGIVKQSGGYIFAENRSDRSGAVFTIYLPVHATPAPVQLAAPRPKPTESWGTGTILLVEDEDMVRAVAERALTRQGYTVITAENGEAALEWLASGDKPDLLVSDVVMPQMDGPTMARHARERYPDLPILFMSGYAEEQLRRSIDLERVAFLPKPFSVQQLADGVRTALAATPAG